MKRAAQDVPDNGDDPNKRLRIVPACLAGTAQAPTPGPMDPASAATAPPLAAAAPPATMPPPEAGPPAQYAPPALPATPLQQMPPSFGLQGPQTQALWSSIFSGGQCAVTDIDDSVFKSLADFHDGTAVEIVNGFARADLNTVRNKTGFIIGILKSFRKKGQGLKSGGPPPATAAYGGYGGYYGASYDPYSGAATAASADPNAPPAAPPAAGAYDPYAAYGYPPAAQPPQMYMYTDPTTGQQYAAPQYYDASQYYAQQPAAPPSYGGGGGGSGRTKGMGLAGLSQPIQDLFKQIFASGQVTDVDVPASIYDSLCDFDEDTQWAIVERFSKADLGRVRNKTGYLIGILKIARQGKATGHGFGAPSAGGGALGSHPAAAYGAGPAGPVTTGDYAPMAQSPKFNQLVPFVQNKLKEMVAHGEIKDGDLDHGVFDSLSAFDEASQVEIVEIFASKDLSSIRNKTGFFIGILKKQRVLKQNQDMVSAWQ